MTTYQQIAATIARRIKSDGPDPYETAQLFAPHGKCADITTMHDGDTGIIERNDDALMTVTFDVDDRNWVTGWRYALYAGKDSLDDADESYSADFAGTLDDVAWDITENVTDWLDESFQPAHSTDGLALHALAYTLEDDGFNQVEVSEHNGHGIVLVTHDNEHAMRIKPDYSNDGIKDYLRGYDCTLLPPQGEQAVARFDDLDELRDALEAQQNIDEDAAVAAFVQQVDSLFSGDVWRLDNGGMDDVVAGWEPIDFDEERYQDRVNAMGIRWAHLGAYGEVESVEMVAIGDFWGEDAEELWGGHLARWAAAWLEDAVDSHQPDEFE